MKKSLYILSEHRKAEGLKGAEIAKRLGVQRQTVYGVETGRFPLGLKAVRKWAKAYGLEPNILALAVLEQKAMAAGFPADLQMPAGRLVIIDPSDWVVPDVILRSERSPFDD
jgi:transcriptional regulator with XRE-family HTH domain